MKAIATFLIVCIHIPFPGIFGEYFVAIARVAVPIFFMITGFYWKPDYNYGKRQLTKIVRLFVFANLLFLIWKSVLSVICGISVAEYFLKTFTMKNLIKLVCLNDSPFSGHLWYLGAVLYVLIIVNILNRVGWTGLLYIFMPILLLLDLVLGKYSLLLFGREFPYVLVRNFLCVGLPYFAIGVLIRKRWQKNKTYSLTLGVFFFVVMNLMERFNLESLEMNATRDHYASTTFLATDIFLFFMSIYRERKLCVVERWLALVGRRYSTTIYIIHPILITMLSAVAKSAGIYEYYRYIGPILVYCCSVFGAMICTEFMKNIRKNIVGGM